jgi:hypothetical protein
MQAHPYYSKGIGGIELALKFYGSPPLWYHDALPLSREGPPTIVPHEDRLLVRCIYSKWSHRILGLINGEKARRIIPGYLSILLST